MFKYIQELLQNILRETSRTKMKPKKNKNTGNTYQSKGGKTSVKPEVLALVGTERKDIERSPDFVKLKNTYDLLMKRLTNSSIEQPLSNLETVQRIKTVCQEKEKAIVSLLVPDMLKGNTKRDLPLAYKECSMTKEDTTLTETTSIGWSGQVTKSSLQPKVEVALYPGDIASALLNYPGKEDCLENGKEAQTTVRKQKSQMRSFSGRKIKPFHDKTYLRRFENLPTKMKSRIGTNSQNTEMVREEKKSARKSGYFTKFVHGYTKNIQFPYIIQSALNVTSMKKKSTAGHHTIESKPTPVEQNNDLVNSTLSEVRELSSLNREKNERGQIFPEKPFETKEIGKDNYVETEVEGNLGLKTKYVSDNNCCKTSIVTNQFGSSEICKFEQNSNDKKKLSTETDPAKPLDMNDKRKITIFNSVEKKSADLQREKNHSKLEKYVGSTDFKTTNITQPNNLNGGLKNVKTDTNISKVKLTKTEKSVNCETCDVEYKPCTSKSKQLYSETNSLLKTTEIIPNHSNSESLLDDLNYKYKAELRKTIDKNDKTNVLGTKISQEDLIHTKIGGLSTFKLLTNGNTNFEGESKQEIKELCNTKEPSLKTSVQNQNIDVTGSLSQLSSVETNVTNANTDYVNQEKVITCNSNNLTSNNLQKVSSQNKIYNLLDKSDSCDVKNNLNLSEDPALKIKLNEKKINSLKPFGSKETKSKCSNNAKSLIKNQNKSLELEKFPLESINNLKNNSNYTYNNFVNKSRSLSKDLIANKNKKSKMFKKDLCNSEEIKDQLEVRLHPKTLSSKKQIYNTSLTNFKKGIKIEVNNNISAKSFLKQKGITNDIPIPRIDKNFEGKLHSLKHFQSKKCLNAKRKNNHGIKRAIHELDGKLSRKKLIKLKSNNNKNVLKSSISLINLNSKNQENIDNSYRLLEKNPNLKTMKNHTLENKSFESGHLILYKKRTLYTKDESKKKFQTLPSLKKYGEENPLVHGIKSVKFVKVVEKKTKRNLKSSNKISIDRLSSANKSAAALNCSFFPQNIQTRTFSTAGNSTLMLDNLMQKQFSRISIDHRKQLYNTINTKLDLKISQSPYCFEDSQNRTNGYRSDSKNKTNSFRSLKPKPFKESRRGSTNPLDKIKIQYSKKKPPDAIKKNRNKLGFKTKRKTVKKLYKSKNIPSTIHGDFNDKNGSIEVLFSRQEQNNQPFRKSHMVHNEMQILKNENTSQISPSYQIPLSNTFAKKKPMLIKKMSKSENKNINVSRDVLTSATSSYLVSDVNKNLNLPQITKTHFHNIKPSMVSNNNLIQKSFPLTSLSIDNRPRWKSKLDRILNWELSLGKSRKSKALINLKLRSKIKTNSVQTIPSHKNNSDFVYDHPTVIKNYTKNNRSHCMNKFIQEVDNVLKKVNKNELKTGVITTNNPIVNNKPKKYNIDEIKSYYQGKIDVPDLKLNANKYNKKTKCSLVSESKSYDCPVKLIVPVDKEKTKNGIRNTVSFEAKQTNKNVTSKVMKQLTYCRKNNDLNAYAVGESGIRHIHSNQTLNRFVKRHTSTSSLKLNKHLFNSISQRPKTATMTENTETATYKFDPGLLASIKLPQIQFKTENKMIKTEQPKYPSKQRSKIFETNNFIPSSKLKELLFKNLELQDKNISLSAKISLSKKSKLQSKLENNNKTLQQSIEMIPIDIMIKQLCEKKDSLPLLNSRRVDNNKEIDNMLIKQPLQGKSLSRLVSRENKLQKKLKNNLIQRKNTNTSKLSTSVNKLNNVKPAKSENVFEIEKIKVNPLIDNRFGNNRTKLSRKLCVRPATSTPIAPFSRCTQNNYTKEKENNKPKVAFPSKTSTCAKPNQNLESILINQFWLFQKSISSSKKSKKPAVINMSNQDQLLPKRRSSNKIIHKCNSFDITKQSTLSNLQTKESIFETNKKISQKPLKKPENYASRRNLRKQLHSGTVYNANETLSDKIKLCPNQMEQRKQYVGSKISRLDSLENSYKMAIIDDSHIKNDKTPVENRNKLCTKHSINQIIMPVIKEPRKLKPSFSELSR